MVYDNQKTSLNRQPERPAVKGKLKSFMDYIDICLAENVRNDEIIFAEIKAMGYTGRCSMPRYYIQSDVNAPVKERFASKLSQDTTSPPHPGRS